MLKASANTLFFFILFCHETALIIIHSIILQPLPDRTQFDLDKFEVQTGLFGCYPDIQTPKIQ